MCGFVGIINKDNKIVNSHLLKSMASVIHHRGPDEEGIFVDGPVGFYHKRLSIIDLSTGRQPMTFNGCTIVYNGEIYNYIELRDDLKRKDIILIQNPIQKLSYICTRNSEMILSTI